VFHAKTAAGAGIASRLLVLLSSFAPLPTVIKEAIMTRKVCLFLAAKRSKRRSEVRFPLWNLLDSWKEAYSDQVRQLVVAREYCDEILESLRAEIERLGN